MWFAKKVCYHSDPFATVVTLLSQTVCDYKIQMGRLISVIV